MERRTKPNEEKLSEKVKRSVTSQIPEKSEYDGNIETMISTGSTLLDLAISGGRKKGGGVPGGIFVEAFGPNSAGKTVLLCEMAGAIQRQGGEILFRDPEARLNQQFAQMFDLNTKEMDYDTVDTVTELFTSVRDWEVKNEKIINGIFADSLAALSTDLEMSKDEGDKMGMKRAKEFSEQLRRTCRVLTQKNLLMVCSNQIRQNAEGYGEKFTAPGGMGPGFYASLRLKFGTPEKIPVKKMICGKEVTRIIGVRTEVTVYKSSIWKPFHSAFLTIIFDYGIDDIRENLQFIKDHKEKVHEETPDKKIKVNKKGEKQTIYTCNGEKLDVSLEKSVKMIEHYNLQKVVKAEVIELWESIETKFETSRTKKERD